MSNPNVSKAFVLGFRSGQAKFCSSPITAELALREAEIEPDPKLNETWSLLTQAYLNGEDDGAAGDTFRLSEDEKKELGL